MTLPDNNASDLSDASARPADPLVCPTCGYRPAQRGELIPHRDDLATVWLHLDDREQVREQRHCTRCQPHEGMVAVTCGRCGDGPLVTGTSSSYELPSPVLAWLEQHGWRTTPELLCGNHI